MIVYDFNRQELELTDREILMVQLVVEAHTDSRLFALELCMRLEQREASREDYEQMADGICEKLNGAWPGLGLRWKWQDDPAPTRSPVPSPASPPP